MMYTTSSQAIYFILVQVSLETKGVVQDPELWSLLLGGQEWAGKGLRLYSPDKKTSEPTKVC